MDFRKYLDLSAHELDREVEQILKSQLNEAKAIDKKLIPLLKSFGKSCQGGKRIRGILVKLGYEIAAHLPGVKAHLGGEKAIFRIAAAYEILHAAILIHDDIIDKSTIRRGKPSLYQSLGGNHYGISQALTLADYGFFLVINIISEANFPQNYKICALKLFSKVIMETGLGQMLELEKADWQKVMKLKTARYTICGPLTMGAVLAGADAKLIKVLDEFGENLGIAFQIQDDILDGETKKYKQSLKQLRCYTNQALKVLPRITKDKGMSKILQQLAEYLVNRKT